MTEQSRKVFDDFQIRKSRKQKEAFRAWLCGELERAGYSPRVEKGFAAKNVVIGDPDAAEIIFSAHYDTCAVLPIPNFITPRNMFFYALYQLLFLLIFLVIVFIFDFILFSLDASPAAVIPLSYVLCIFLCWWILAGPANRHTANDNTSGVLTLLEAALAMPEELREGVCFVFFDNEEKGLFGSAAFTKRHKRAKKETLNVNFDCVSDGDYLQFFPDKRMKKRNPEALDRLEAAFQGGGDKRVEVVRGRGFYPSDNKAFWNGVGVCALKHKRVIGYYMDRIHTNRDTVLEEENIELLKNGAVKLVELTKKKGLT